MHLVACDVRPTMPSNKQHRIALGVAGQLPFSLCCFNFQEASEVNVLGSDCVWICIFFFFYSIPGGAWARRLDILCSIHVTFDNKPRPRHPSVHQYHSSFPIIPPQHDLTFPIIYIYDYTFPIIHQYDRTSSSSNQSHAATVGEGAWLARGLASAVHLARKGEGLIRQVNVRALGVFSSRVCWFL